MADIQQNYNPELVVMKNPIVTSKLNFTPLQAQILLEMVAKIHPLDENFNEIRISVKEFAQKIGVDNSQIYENIEKATKGMNTWIRVKESDESDYTDLVLLTKVKYWKRKGYVDLKFHEDLKPYLLQIKESSFFSYHIEATRKLGNYAFIKLYWLLVSWKNVGTKVFDLENLKEVLELQGKYTQFPDFRKRVLQPARNAFIKYGEIYFDFQEIRATKSQKSPVEKIKFTMIPNPNWKQRKKVNFGYIEPVEPDINSSEIQELLKGILSLSKDISQSEAIQFIKNHTAFETKDILSEIIAIKKKKAKGKEVIDYLATLSTYVVNKYSTGLYEEQEEKRKEQEEQTQILTWLNEWETRFGEFKMKMALEATEEEISTFKTHYKHLLNMKGEPMRDFLGEFISVSRGLVPEDKKKNFMSWVRKNKGEILEERGEKFTIIKNSLF